ncbi:bile acid:sodium symporter family protein [Adhaeribacter aquaticus]|uniref:bile acid:sodium symporter family protein n=1 Tax=Adhaeribacter aquaticus TaxID=299567 RepID=UPI003CCBDFC7
MQPNSKNTPNTPQKAVLINRNASFWVKTKTIAARAGFDGFLLALLCIIILAYAWPQLGAEESALPLAQIGTVGVSVIFFFYGLRLSPEKLKSGLTNWRLHLLVQCTTFLLFPLLLLGARSLFANQEEELLWLGICYVGALPSTVSSSVVMVSIAGGNLPAAIFNASISSLLGVFLTPFWMSFLLESNSTEFDFASVIGKLMIQVVAPVIVGILMHSRLGGFAERHKSRLKLFDQSIILLIVYTAFCDSFARNLFAGYSTLDIILLALAMSALFFLVLGLVQLIGKFLGLSQPDQITAMFCGSKKSMVHGTVMSKVLFPDTSVVGIILLPLMLYHALQLIYASAMAQSMARKSLPQ